MSEPSEAGRPAAEESDRPAQVRSYGRVMPGVGVGIGVGAGVVVGAIFGAPGAGAAVGALLGVVIGSWGSRRIGKRSC